MKAIHRKELSEVELGRPFFAPKNVTFGYQSARRAFSLWYLQGDPFSTEYVIVGTGHEILNGNLRATVVMPDGHHVFHLVEAPIE